MFAADTEQVPVSASGWLVVAVFAVAEDISVQVTAFPPTTPTSILEHCPFLEEADRILTCQPGMHNVLASAYMPHTVRLVELVNAGRANHVVTRMIKDYGREQQQRQRRTVHGLNKATGEMEEMVIDEFFDQFRYRPCQR
jgi:hypothetical protein